MPALNAERKPLKISAFKVITLALMVYFLGGLPVWTNLQCNPHGGATHSPTHPPNPPTQPTHQPVALDVLGRENLSLHQILAIIMSLD